MNSNNQSERQSGCMSKLKILNLYAGIGGNRKLWGDDHDITAVEINPKIAECYQKLFPNDTVIVGDAHEYLRQHFREFDSYGRHRRVSATVV